MIGGNDESPQEKRMIPKHLQVPLSTAAPSLWASRRLFLASSLLIVTALSILGSGQTAPSAKPKLTLDEFFSAVDFTKVQISPDGHMVVIATERADWDNERFRQDLWLWRDNGRGLIPLTQSGHDSSPRWSNDGKWIAFLSDRSEEGDNSAKSAGSADDDDKEVTHLYVIPVDGGEAFPVTRGEEEVHSFAWSSRFEDAVLLHPRSVDQEAEGRLQGAVEGRDPLPGAGTRRRALPHLGCGRACPADRPLRRIGREERSRRTKTRRLARLRARRQS